MGLRELRILSIFPGQVNIYLPFNTAERGVSGVDAVRSTVTGRRLGMRLRGGKQPQK